MKTYIIKIEILSAIITPLQADTIWGHICWGIKNNEGEIELKKFLKAYDHIPPLILSDPFPENYLPMPILKPFVFGKNEFTLKKYKNIKKIKKRNYIKKEMLFNEDGIGGKSFYSDKTELINNTKYVEITKNVINRLKNQTKDEKGVYSIKEWWVNGSKNIYDIYLLSILDKDTILKYFKYAFEFGYGADISTGKGKIKVIENSLKEIEINSSNCNKCMALSAFVPTVEEKNRFKNFRYDIYTKFGKLGNEYVYNKNPFKAPIIFYKAGATFDMESLYNNGKVKQYTGTLLKNIHKDEKIRHYAFAPLIFFKECVE